MSTIAANSTCRRQFVYDCGPAKLVIDFENAAWRESLHGLLSQYDAPWPTQTQAITVSVNNDSVPAFQSGIIGRYLTLQRLRVDCIDGRLVSIGKLGSRMEIETNAGCARIYIPPQSDDVALVEEIEQHFVLLLARAWAHAGWGPVHAGSLVPADDSRCVLLCAPSGSGKTTLTASLLRRGWRTLGDDKTLLRLKAGAPCARALARRFHLHPEAARWFPEAGSLTVWPRYSRWTEKRLVQIDEIWPGCLLDEATPAALVQLERNPDGPAITVVPIHANGVLNSLLRQVVIPGEPGHARPLVNCVAQTASRLKGARILIGPEAFASPGVADELEQTLQSLLT